MWNGKAQRRGLCGRVGEHFQPPFNGELMQVVTKTHIREYPLLSRGKVRDIYEIDPQTFILLPNLREPIVKAVVARHFFTIRTLGVRIGQE